MLPSATVKLMRVAAVVSTGGQTRVATTMLALVLCLLGCAPSGDPVQLLTGVVPGYTENGGCFTNFAVGPLLVDPTYGTAVRDETGGNAVTPVMWRPGFTGRRVGSEVMVVGPIGQLVATTGRSYQIEGGYWFENPNVFVACGAVIQK